MKVREDALGNRYFSIVRNDWSGSRMSDAARRFFTELYLADSAEGCEWKMTRTANRFIFSGKQRAFSLLPVPQESIDGLKTGLSDFKYRYNPASKAHYRGKFAHHTLSLAHEHNGILQLVIECDDLLPDWRNDFVSEILGHGTLIPVLHTPSLIKQLDGTYLEVWNRSHLAGREYCDLTGHGEAEALRLLAAFCAGLNRRLEPSTIPRRIDVEKALTESNLVWFGSCFNHLHGVREILDNRDFWKVAPPSCLLEGFPNHVNVSYPGSPKIVTNHWPPEEPESSYALVRSVLTVHGTRMTIAAGTNTEATLRAARFLLGVEKSDINRLAQIRAQADSQAQFEMLFETMSGRLSPVTKLVWPNPEEELKSPAALP